MGFCVGSAGVQGMNTLEEGLMDASSLHPFKHRFLQAAAGRFSRPLPCSGVCGGVGLACPGLVCLDCTPCTCTFLYPLTLRRRIKLCEEIGGRGWLGRRCDVR